VSRVLCELDDSRPFAQRVLRSQGIALAKHIIERMETATMTELIKLAGKLDMVRDDRTDNSASPVLIAIGAPGQPLPEALAPPVISLPTEQPTGYVRPNGSPILKDEMASAKCAVLIGVAPPGTPPNPIPLNPIHQPVIEAAVIPAPVSEPRDGAGPGIPRDGASGGDQRGRGVGAKRPRGGSRRAAAAANKV